MENLIAQLIYTCRCIYQNTLGCGAPFGHNLLLDLKAKMEIKNGISIGKNIIHQQLLHNIDASLTLHLLKCNVLLQESPATISFTNYC